MTRRRPVVQITLSNGARERLDEMATRCGESRSSMVERLVHETEMPHPRPKPALVKRKNLPKEQRIIQRNLKSHEV